MDDRRRDELQEVIRDAVKEKELAGD